MLDKRPGFRACTVRGHPRLQPEPIPSHDPEEFTSGSKFLGTKIPRSATVVQRSAAASTSSRETRLSGASFNRRTTQSVCTA